MKRHTFTLLEILIAIGIILILASITVGGLAMSSGKADDAKTTAVMKDFEMALEKYKADKGVYPVQKVDSKETDDGVAVDLSDDRWKKFNAGNYLSGRSGGELMDGYDFPLFYRYPGLKNKGKYDLWSVGKDGKHGNDSTKTKKDYGDIDKAGEDGSDDICNWRQQ